MAAVSMAAGLRSRSAGAALAGDSAPAQRVAVMPYCARRVRRRRGVISTLRTRCHFYLAPTVWVERECNRLPGARPSRVPFQVAGSRYSGRLATGRIQLGLGQVFGAGQDGVVQVGVVQVGAGQVGAGQDGVVGRRCAGWPGAGWHLECLQRLSLTSRLPARRSAVRLP